MFSAVATSWTIETGASSLSWVGSASQQLAERFFFKLTLALLSQLTGKVMTFGSFHQSTSNQLGVRWTPSHIDVVRCDSAEEEFFATWNDVADGIAVSQNEPKGAAFADLRQRATAYYDFCNGRLRKLRSFYLSVADARDDTDLCIGVTDETDDWSDRVLSTLLSEALPVNWRNLVNAADPFQHFPIGFVFQMFDRCFALESSGGRFEATSFVELVL